MITILKIAITAFPSNQKQKQIVRFHKSGTKEKAAWFKQRCKDYPKGFWLRLKYVVYVLSVCSKRQGNNVRTSLNTVGEKKIDILGVNCDFTGDFLK